MMNNNKILTVSYGTFSCTLEGFEDSFGTMKAIAEYFRDLAADDRYFGAEPPQPDADMLARIAQKEVSRRVEAREQDGKIVLSALEDNTTATPAEAETSAAAAAVAAPLVADLVAEDKAHIEAVALEVEADPIVADDGDEITVEEAETAVDTAPVALDEIDDLTADDAPVAIEDADTPEETTAPVADLVTAPTDEATEVAALSTEEAEAELLETEENIAEADLKEEQVPEVAADEAAVLDAVSEAFVEDENDIVPGQPDAEVEAFFADSPANPVLEEDAAPHAEDTSVEPAAVEAPAPDSIAAKLQRIRAVVAQHEEAEEDDDYLEDEHAGTAPDLQEETAEVIAEARADIESALEADEAADAAASQDATDDTAETDEVSDILSRLEREVPVQDVVTDAAPAQEPEPEQQSVQETGEDTVNNLFEEDDDSALDAVKGAMAAAEAPKAADEKPAPAAIDDTERLTARRARVIKVKRADLEAAIQKGDLEEYDEETEQDAAPEQAEAPEERPGLNDLAPARKPDTSLSPEDEAELARELADLQADIAAEEPEANTAVAADDTPTHATRRQLPSIDESGDTDMSRLMAEADQQMDEPESATRRDAFAHLRAAVAAKKADSSIAADDGLEADDAYRSDLAEVVRPRRPSAKQSRTERPGDARPAPLKLVAEQRVDVEQPKPSGPVRPRRVAAVTDAAPEAPEGESFADFASDMGANTLPQLLEAAAAYMSFVEGRDQFSRPQLMTKVRQAGGEEEFTREEGLRSFGQLLRAGKIEKIKGGRFTVSDEIGYRPDQRAAG
ncbi:MAG: hypothetical protein AB8B60_13550 [Sulfitobacter sp.]